MSEKYYPTVEPMSDEFQLKRGWKLFIDGKEVPVVHSLRLVNEKIGEVNYGKAQEGEFDIWRFHEIGGGGSVILPYIILNHELYVGVIKQMRPNMGGEVYSAIGGFLKMEETHFETACRETLEELGFNPSQRLKELSGIPGNSNRLFFETFVKNEGLRFFGFKLRKNEVESVPQVPGGKLPCYKIRANLLKPVTAIAEKIMGSILIHWTEAVRLSDIMVGVAVARLLADLADLESPL